MLDVRRSEPSLTCRRTCVSSGVDTTATRRPSVSGAVVVGRRDLPSRGLGLAVSPAPLKRCRVDTPSSRPAHLDHFVIHRHDVTDDKDRDKENRRPDCDQVAIQEPYYRRRRVDCDVSSSRCAEKYLYSPDNHVYHTLEPTADCQPADQLLFSPVYESIDFDDVVDMSAELSDQRRHHRKLPSTSHVTTSTSHVTQRRRQDSKIHKTKKRVTFNVSIHTTRIFSRMTTPS